MKNTGTLIPSPSISPAPTPPTPISRTNNCLKYLILKKLMSCYPKRGENYIL